MKKISIPEAIRQIAQHALSQIHILVPEWFPDGTQRGPEWIARNIVRGDREAGSFGISLDTGRWNDFADPDAHGGDLVSLLAYLRQCNQLEAAKEIDSRLGIGLLCERSVISTPAPTLDQNKIQERIRQREQEDQQKRQRAERKANQLWESATPADPNHPYLIKKGLPPLELRQTRDGTLLIPIGKLGHLVNLQLINQHCEKRFLSGGQVKSFFAAIGPLTPKHRVYICEGWATGASIHLSTGHPVICALSAANLEPVTKFMRERFGELIELVIAGDDDRNTEGNPGKAYAMRAALNCKAKVVFPVWPAEAPRHLTDFNDLDLWNRALQDKESIHG